MILTIMTLKHDMEFNLDLDFSTSRCISYFGWKIHHHNHHHHQRKEDSNNKKICVAGSQFYIYDLNETPSNLDRHTAINSDRKLSKLNTSATSPTAAMFVSGSESSPSSISVCDYSSTVFYDANCCKCQIKNESEQLRESESNGDHWIECADEKLQHASAEDDSIEKEEGENEHIQCDLYFGDRSRSRSRCRSRSRSRLNSNSCGNFLKRIDTTNRTGPGTSLGAFNSDSNTDNISTNKSNGSSTRSFSYGGRHLRRLGRHGNGSLFASPFASPFASVMLVCLLYMTCFLFPTTRCQTDVNFCNSNSSNSSGGSDLCVHGACMEEVNGFSCNCTQSYTGLYCDVSVSDHIIILLPY